MSRVQWRGRTEGRRAEGWDVQDVRGDLPVRPPARHPSRILRRPFPTVTFEAERPESPRLRSRRHASPPRPRYTPTSSTCCGRRKAAGKVAGTGLPPGKGPRRTRGNGADAGGRSPQEGDQARDRHVRDRLLGRGAGVHHGHRAVQAGTPPAVPVALGDPRRCPIPRLPQGRYRLSPRKPACRISPRRPACRRPG
jgi:hypothetical protein